MGMPQNLKCILPRLNAPWAFKSEKIFSFTQVLVYDRYGQDIISPLLNVKELREMGITLHL